MKNIVSEMLQHPIATILIISTLGSTIASIVAASKGIPSAPFMNIS